MKNVINAPYNGKNPDGTLKTYLSDLPEFANGLPFGLIHKGITGCGGTTLEFKTKRHSIICMPYVELVEQKATLNNAFAVKAGVKSEHINRYVMDNRNGFIKLVTTYDSLPKVIEGIDDIASLNPYKDFHLLVDEYHSLFHYYKDRRDAVQSVLLHSLQFAEYGKLSCLTATPLIEGFELVEFKNLPIHEVNWNGFEYNKPIVNTSKIHSTYFLRGRMFVDVNFRLDYEDSPNLHFFVNSAGLIKSIIENEEIKNRLNPDNTRVVYSPSNDGYPELEKFRSKQAKAINFYTSTGFEGIDIHDHNGKTIIISDASKWYTLEDPSSRLTQIIGRIRDCTLPADEQVFHYYTLMDKSDLKYSEVKESSLKQLEHAKDAIRDIQTGNVGTLFSQTGVKSIEQLNEEYLNVRDGKLYVDENLHNRHLFSYRLSRLYQDKKWYQMEMHEVGYTIQQAFQYVKGVTAGKRSIFKNDCESYFALIQHKDKVTTNPDGTVTLYFCPEDKDQVIKQIEHRYKFLEDAVNKLGIARIRELNYNMKTIKRLLINMEPINQNTRLLKAIKEKYERGNIIPAKEVKEELQQIYNLFNINKTAKGSDLKNWFEVESIIKKTDGEVFKAYKIIGDKYVFNS